MPENKHHLITITDPRKDRYASLRLIDWWDQERIAAAHVMVVGCGALGNEVLKNLALLGIGHLFLVDFDRIEASNLTRSVFYRPEDGGQSKARIAAERVRSLNPDITVGFFHGDVTKELGTGVYRQMDLVIGCMDNRAARLAVNQACWNVNVPWVDGALGVLDGLVRTFVPPDSSCYECTLTEQDYDYLNIRYSCPPGFIVTRGREPTLPTVASIIAAMQVQEAIKLLHGQSVQAGRAVYYHSETMQTTHMDYPRKPECYAHTSYGKVIELPCSVHGSTLAGLCEQINTFLLDDGVLFLPREIVTAFYCANCDVEEEVVRPYDLMVPDQVPCSRCGSPRVFDIMSTLPLSHTRWDIPLADLGIPALHILPVRAGTDWFYFELSADKATFL